MGYLLGGIFCIWGIIIIVNGIFKMNENDFKAKSRFFTNVFFELEFITIFLRKLPVAAIKSSVILIGTAFVGFGLYLFV
ncbi:hypothetical protein [Oceanobacillus jeddahense]|uniref:Uncharacterized protein n=1 Tax=Oceanobacillus jeddahense TaxID=1462527 RepID=A0ABY5JMA2_9BACI|nr:hypothetical protein [Oceanobacillus jeddahense]UUI01261.1 hypothetical protein NP439_14460 [Oceanobacillus jeddahense]